MAATDLYDMCAEYLDACNEALVDTPGGAIDRAFVSPGPPAWDCCPQLTVHAGGPAVGDTMPLQPPLQPGERLEVGIVTLVAMTATILRCTPTVEEGGDLPSAHGLDVSAAETLADVWAIWNHIATLKRAGTLWAPKTREVFFDPAVSLNSAGGCAGWQLQIRVFLPGYRTA